MDRASPETASFCGGICACYPGFRGLPRSSNIVLGPSLAESGNGVISSTNGPVWQFDRPAHARDPRSIPIEGGEQSRTPRHAASAPPEGFAWSPNRGLPWSLPAREYQTRMVGLGQSSWSLFDH